MHVRKDYTTTYVYNAWGFSIGQAFTLWSYSTLSNRVICCLNIAIKLIKGKSRCDVHRLDYA